MIAPPVTQTTTVAAPPKAEVDRAHIMVAAFVGLISAVLVSMFLRGWGTLWGLIIAGVLAWVLYWWISRSWLPNLSTLYASTTNRNRLSDLIAIGTAVLATLLLNSWLAGCHEKEIDYEEVEYQY